MRQRKQEICDFAGGSRSRRSFFMTFRLVLGMAPALAQNDPSVRQMLQDQQQAQDNADKKRKALEATIQEERQLNAILAAATAKAYHDLLSGGVHLDDAASLYETLKRELMRDIVLSKLNGDASGDFITFSSYTFMIFTNYVGAIAPRGTGRLIAVDGHISDDANPCTYQVEIKSFFTAQGVEPGGWRNETRDYSCSTIALGTSSEDMKHFVLEAVAKAIKGALMPTN
jgi:hypothetical protein